MSLFITSKILKSDVITILLCCFISELVKFYVWYVRSFCMGLFSLLYKVFCYSFVYLNLYGEAVKFMCYCYVNGKYNIMCINDGWRL